MNTVDLYFNIKDIFRAPRLALSGKKIFIFIQGNLAGFISYWLFSILAFYINGNNVNDIISKYGLSLPIDPNLKHYQVLKICKILNKVVI